jgi:YVTN family beta-propeller protein
MLSAGEVIAGCRIERLLGRGGMGVVYLAMHLALGRPVALKVIAPALAGDPGFRERFLREARLAAALDHPNVIAIYDAGQYEDALYISMRYVDGVDLRTLIAAQGRLEPARAARIASQVAAALDAAHARGLVHRDVKPANVLVADPGGSEQVYLTDFGLVKRSASQVGVTGPGQWVGTVGYVAPEQLRGDPVDRRADVYALGCVLYEALTAQPPFPRENDVAVLWAHLSDPPPLPSDVVPAARGLDSVVVRALAKDPGERHQSAGELGRAALAGAAGAPDTSAPTRVAATPRAVVPVEPPRRRRRLRWAALAAAALLAAVGVAVALVGREPETPPRPIQPAGRIVSEIRVWRPQAGELNGELVVGAGAIWAANPYQGLPGCPRCSAVVPIDPRTNRAGRPIRLRTAPHAVAADDTAVWLLELSANPTVTRVDPRSGVPGRAVRVGKGAVGIAAGAGGVWVLHTGRSPAQKGRLWWIDPRTHQLAARPTRVGRLAYAVAVGAGAVWVSNAGDDEVMRIDPVTRRPVAGIPVGDAPGGLAVADGAVWVANVEDWTLTRVDPRIDRATGTPVQIPHADGTGVFAGVFAVGAGGIWIARAEEKDLIRVDSASGRPLGRPIRLPDNPADIVAADGAVWVSIPERGVVVRVSPTPAS